MISFTLSVIALILGYIFYSKFVEKVFGIEPERKTPAIANGDGVDYVPLDWKRAFLVQFLNIAGLGPIFGAIAGALWGPVAFLWIVFGCIFAGGVHDYFSGMLSLRHNGISIAEIVGMYLGVSAKIVMRVFSVILLLLTGVVFVTGPAGILENMTSVNKMIWVGVIIVYYMLATVLPVDKIIGKIYPVFGASLIIMGLGIIIALFAKGYQIPEIHLMNYHPDGKAIFPFLFITIACGAISGFHATQSPIISRCVKNEKEGRRIFYGAMVAEGIVALIWAAAAMTFFGGTAGLQQAGEPAVIVSVISTSLLGAFGGILSILGVVACPITSGDTAFRSARLTIADALNYKQDKIGSRFLIAIPLFVIGTALCFMDFSVIWRYFAWSNQTLATIVLWASTSYLIKQHKNYLITAFPATFMTAVVVSYILIAEEGFRLPGVIGYTTGIICAILALATALYQAKKSKTALA